MVYHNRPGQSSFFHRNYPRTGKFVIKEIKSEGRGMETLFESEASFEEYRFVIMKRVIGYRILWSMRIYMYIMSVHNANT